MYIVFVDGVDAVTGGTRSSISNGETLLVVEVTSRYTLWKMSFVEVGSSHAKVLPKNLLVLHLKNEDSRDPLFQWSVHPGSKDGEIRQWRNIQKEVKQ